jgi:hypothetical protein
VSKARDALQMIEGIELKMEDSHFREKQVLWCCCLSMWWDAAVIPV